MEEFQKTSMEALQLYFFVWTGSYGNGVAALFFRMANDATLRFGRHRTHTDSIPLIAIEEPIPQGEVGERRRGADCRVQAGPR